MEELVGFEPACPVHPAPHKVGMDGMALFSGIWPWDQLASFSGHFGLGTSSNPNFLTMVASSHFVVVGEGLVGLRAADPTHPALNKSWRGWFDSIPWYLALGPDNIIFWLFWPRDQF